MMSLLRYWGQPTLPSLIDPRHHRWLVLAVGAAAQASFAAAFAGLPVTGVLMRHAYAMSTGQLGLVLGCMALGVTFGAGLGPAHRPIRRPQGPAHRPAVHGPGAVRHGLFLAPDAAHMPSPCNWAAGWCWWACWGQRQLLVGPGHHGLVHRRQARPGHEHPADGIPAGGAIGAALLPWVAQHHGFRTVFATLAAFCVLTALLTWLFLHERPHPPPTGPQDPARRASPRHCAVRTSGAWPSPAAC
jgi:MFS family permease